LRKTFFPLGIILHPNFYWGLYLKRPALIDGQAPGKNACYIFRVVFRGGGHPRGLFASRFYGFMIITVTLNASIDKLYVVDKIELGKVMRVKFVINTAGGKGLNVSRVAGLLGENVLATGIIGGHTGAYFEKLAKADNIPVNFLKTENEIRSCVNIRELASGYNTEFLESGDLIGEGTLDQFCQKFEGLLKLGDIVVISGSLPPGVPHDYYGRVISLSKASGKTVLVDTSGGALKESLKARPDFIKPNLSELEQIFGTQLSGKREVVNRAKELQENGIDTVAVSLGSDGVLVVSKDGTFEAVPPRIETVNTVGCGDSMVAGFAVGFRRKMGTIDSIRLAVAVSSANALSLRTGHFTEEDFNNLSSRVVVREIIL
jgi:tagatose 6-phosphate kinase